MCTNLFKSLLALGIGSLQHSGSIVTKMILRMLSTPCVVLCRWKWNVRECIENTLCCVWFCVHSFSRVSDRNSMWFYIFFRGPYRQHSHRHSQFIKHLKVYISAPFFFLIFVHLRAYSRYTLLSSDSTQSYMLHSNTFGVFERT